MAEKRRPKVGLALGSGGARGWCHIGILRVDKKGEEFYQVQLGGSSNEKASLGKVLGPSFSRDEMPETIGKILDVFVENRQPEEFFIDTYNRIGLQPFKARVYAKAS